MTTFQDDIICLVVGARGAQMTEEGVRRVAGDRYGITFINKEETTAPFAKIFMSIDAT